MSYKSEVNRNFRTGLQTNRTAFNIEQDAFTELFNAYVWRGRVKKKKGSTLLGRLQRSIQNVSIGNSGASPWTINTIFTASSIGSADTNKDLIAGSLTIVIGAPANITFTDNGDGTLTGSIGGNSGTVNYATGEVVLTHTAGAGIASTASFKYAPLKPVMGLPYRILSRLNVNQSYAFDTTYAYTWNDTSQEYEEAPSTLPTTWSGQDFQQFWPMNAYTALWVTNGVPGFQGYDVTDFDTAAAGPPPSVNVTTSETNNLNIGDQVIFINLTGSASANNGLRGTVSNVLSPTKVTITNPDKQTWTNAAAITGKLIISNQNVVGVAGSGRDGIRWHDGATWMNFNPVLNPVSCLMGCQMIFYYRGRILCLYTQEGSDLNNLTKYPQRARWSEVGTPFDILPVPVDSGQGTEYRAWREDIPGFGGFLDAPTNDEIVSAYFLRDVLVVAFENSSWKLQYTNNRIAPFAWERLNTELGSYAQFSAIPFDKQVLFIGPRGVIACNGIGAERPDMLIPDYAFDIQNQDSGTQRICGIRHYEEQVAMWTVPFYKASSGIYPNQVVLFNYIENCWAILLDSFTCYGYWQPFQATRWQDLNKSDNTWQNTRRSWDSYVVNVGTQLVIAGNQQGFVFRVLNQVDNDNSLEVQTVTQTANNPTRLKVVAHNLRNEMYVQADGFLGDNAVLNGQVFNVSVFDANNIDLYKWDSANDVLRAYDGGSSNYIGNGKLSVIDNFSIVTKKFNPFLDQAVSVRMKQVDFYVDATSSGRFMVDYYVNDENNDPANPATDANPLSNRIETFPNPYEEQEQDKLWHTIFDTVTGNLFQLQCSYGDAEMNDPNIFSSQVTIHAIAPQYQVGSRRLT